MARRADNGRTQGERTFFLSPSPPCRHFFFSQKSTFQGIGYPNAYATPEQAAADPAAYRLNCAQRAHANYTENLGPFLANLLVAGLRFPVYAAAAGVVWLVARVVYTKGYTSDKGPAGRMA